jgi:hypothetical protein
VGEDGCFANFDHFLVYPMGYAPSRYILISNFRLGLRGFEIQQLPRGRAISGSFRPRRDGNIFLWKILIFGKFA